MITAAAGGSVRKNPKGREIGFGRGIRLTEAGRKHPMYVGKLDVFNAPTVHLDEVEALPAGSTVLATNAVSDVQSVEIRTNGSVAWGVQYHPEYPLRELAAIVRRIGTRLIEEGFFADEDDMQDFRARSRYARPRPALQAPVLAARHQQECARQEAARRRGGELDRIPGAADAGEAGKRVMDFSGKHVVVTGGTGALGTRGGRPAASGGRDLHGALCARSRGAALSP